MTYQKTLVDFLSTVLIERRERIVGFASSPRRKTQRKILALFYHELEQYIDPSAVVERFSESVWTSEAYLFCPPVHMGNEFSTLRGALEEDIGDSERLVITRDGLYGCLRTEMSGDLLLSTKRKSN